MTSRARLLLSVVPLLALATPAWAGPEALAIPSPRPEKAARAASLDRELDPGRDLEERRKLVLALAGREVDEGRRATVAVAAADAETTRVDVPARRAAHLARVLDRKGEDARRAAFEAELTRLVALGERGNAKDAIDIAERKANDAHERYRKEREEHLRAQGSNPEDRQRTRERKEETRTELLWERGEERRVNRSEDRKDRDLDRKDDRKDDRAKERADDRKDDRKDAKDEKDRDRKDDRAKERTEERSEDRKVAKDEAKKEAKDERSKERSDERQREETDERRASSASSLRP